MRAMAAAILAARQDARAAAAEQVDDEIAMVSGAIGEQIAPAPPPDNRQEDVINAETAAATYSSAWTALALFALTKWARSGGRGGSIQAAIVKVTTTIEYRLKRLVATEAARARNDEHKERWRGIVKAHPRSVSWRRVAFRRWDARLDRKVCSMCRAHDSEECPIDGAFSQGHEPGEVHPHCRCIATVVVLGADVLTPIGVNNTTPAPYIDGSGGSTGKRAA